VEDQIKLKEKEFQDPQMLDQGFEIEKESQLKAEFHSLLTQEEVKWKQRAKENWLKFGDKNTKFFHASANQKNKSHRIEKILDQEGRLCSNQEEIEEAFINYFTALFTAGENLEVEVSTAAVQRRVTQEMNAKLMADFTKKDIGTALQQIAAL